MALWQKARLKYCVTLLLSQGFAMPILALKSCSHWPLPLNSQAKPGNPEHSGLRHQVSFRVLCIFLLGGPHVAVWASVSMQACMTYPGVWSCPCDKEELNRNMIFPVENSALIYCPTSSPLTLVFQRTETLSDKVLSLPTWKGYGAIASLLKSCCLWRQPQLRFLGRQPLWLPLFLPSIWAGAVVCANSRNFKHVISETTTSLLSFLNKVLGVESPEVLLGLLKPQSWLLNKGQSIWAHGCLSWSSSQNMKNSYWVVTGEEVGVGVGSLPSLLRAVTPSRRSIPVMVYNFVKHKDLLVIPSFNICIISRIWLRKYIITKS